MRNQEVCKELRSHDQEEKESTLNNRLISLFLSRKYVEVCPYGQEECKEVNDEEQWFEQDVTLSQSVHHLNLVVVIFTIDVVSLKDDLCSATSHVQVLVNLLMASGHLEWQLHCDVCGTLRQDDLDGETVCNNLIERVRELNLEDM